jgi:SAM-dependent MidA family methyltransferase
LEGFDPGYCTRYGLELSGYTSQTHFLQGLELTRCLRKWEEKGMGMRKRMGMGNKFKVLIQRKAVGQVLLSGLQFSQALG